MITLLRRLVVGLAIAAGVIVAGAQYAGAVVLQEAPPSAPVGQTLTVSAAGVNILIGVLLPLLLGVLVKPGNPEWVKVIGGIVVAGAATLITEAIRDDGTAVLSWDMFLTFVTVYVPQILAYLGVYKPLGNDTPQGSFNGALGPGVIPFERRSSSTPERRAA
jgi:hypothetical protein